MVTGATGMLGSAVVEVLRERGHDPVVVSRKAGPGRTVVDLGTGVGLPAAVEGADAIIHAASDPRGDARLTDVDGTRRLAQAGIPILYVSIVGVDQHPYKYYKIKREGEIELAKSARQWTVLRATQFHGFVDLMLNLSKLSAGARIPILGHRADVPVLVPRGFRVQPVDHFEVAERICDLTESGPTNAIEQFAGPEQLDSLALAREWATVRGGKIWPLPLVGPTASAYKSGKALAADSVERGNVTWTDYLHGAFGKAAG